MRVVSSCLQNSLLPPSERCRNQTTKAPTGPLNREALLKWLEDKAKAEKDWEEAKPYTKVGWNDA